MKKIITTIMLMMVMSTLAVSSALAGVPVFEIALKDSAGYNNFISALQKAKLLTPEGNITTKGLCVAAWEVATSKQMFTLGAIDPSSYCKSFLNYNYVSYLLKEGSISSGAFRNHPGGWKLPTLTEVTGTATAPVEKSSVAIKVAPVAQHPVVAIVPTVSSANSSIAELEKKFAKLQVQVGNNQQFAPDLQKAEMVINGLKESLAKLQSGDFSPKQKFAILQLVDGKMIALNAFQDSVTIRLDTFESEVATLNQKVATLTERVDGQDGQIQSALPIGYQTIENMFGTEVADSAKYLYFALFILLTGVTLLVYPFVIVRIHSNITTVKKAATEAVEKVNKVSAQVADMIGYVFDEELVKKEVLEQVVVGDSFLLELESTDNGHNVVLEIKRSGDNEVTIMGALRQKGSSTALICGLGTVVRNINRAIHDGRIDVVMNLKAVA